MPESRTETPSFEPKGPATGATVLTPAAPDLQATASVPGSSAPTEAKAPDVGLMQEFAAPPAVPLTPNQIRYQAAQTLTEALLKKWRLDLHKDPKTAYYPSNETFNDKIDSLREHHLDEVAVVVEVAIRELPGIQVTGELKALAPKEFALKDRLAGLTVAFPEEGGNPAHEWALEIYVNQHGTRYGAGKEALDLTFSAWNAAEKIEVIETGQNGWTEEDTPIAVAVDIAAVVRKLPESRAEILDDRDA